MVRVLFHGEETGGGGRFVHGSEEDKHRGGRRKERAQPVEFHHERLVVSSEQSAVRSLRAHAFPDGIVGV